MVLFNVLLVISYLLLSQVEAWAPSVAPRNLRIQQNLHMTNNFVLSDYVQRTLLQRQSNSPEGTSGDNNIMEIGLIDFDDAFASFDGSKECSTLILVDLSVRTASDLSEAAAKLPFLPTLLAKMESAGQGLKEDKFLHVHDVGVTDVCRVGWSQSSLSLRIRL